MMNSWGRSDGRSDQCDHYSIVLLVNMASCYYENEKAESLEGGPLRNDFLGLKIRAVE